MKSLLTLFTTLLLAPLAAIDAAEHLIRPGESPQAVLDAAAAGDRLVFLPGLHQHRLSQHRAMLYVDKSVEVELREGAVFKLAPGVCKVESEGEITTDQDAGKKLDDLEIGGTFDTSQPAVDGPESYGATIYTIAIDGTGSDGKPDTFAWGDGKIFDTPHKQVPITGDWQTLSHGVKVRFGNLTGHSSDRQRHQERRAGHPLLATLEERHHRRQPSHSRQHRQTRGRRQRPTRLAAPRAARAAKQSQSSE